jgi:GDP-4-dehydro-6-deoxy-D-mannose reductase
VPAEIRVDPAKLRQIDIPRLVGNADKIRAIGWAPRWTIRQALEDVLADVTGS